MTFKPKKQQIHVPGYGVVQKEDFGPAHFNVLMKRAGDNRDEFIKQHLVVDSYDDLPIFAEDEAELDAKKAEKEKQKAEAKAKKEAEAEVKKQAKKQAEDEAELQRQIEEEEKNNSK